MSEEGAVRTVTNWRTRTPYQRLHVDFTKTETPFRDYDGVGHEWNSSMCVF